VPVALRTSNRSRRYALQILLTASTLPALAQSTPKVKLIIFDVGGTIIEDRGDVVRTLIASMQAHGVTVTPEEIAPFRGAAKHSVIAHFVDQKTKVGGKERQALARTIYKDFVQQVNRAYNDVPAIAGTEEAFRKLTAAGYLLAANTGFEREIVIPILSRLRWQSFFKAVIASDDVTEGRPAPYQIFHAMELAQVHDGAEVIVIGDTPLDLRAAHNARVGAIIGVLSGVGTEQQLSREPHTAILPSVAALPQYLMGDIRANSTQK
jgi:phosphonatase-like hydrolase